MQVFFTLRSEWSCKQYRSEDRDLTKQTNFLEFYSVLWVKEPHKVDHSWSASHYFWIYSVWGGGRRLMHLVPIDNNISFLINIWALQSAVYGKDGRFSDSVDKSIFILYRVQRLGPSLANIIAVQVSILYFTVSGNERAYNASCAQR